MKRILLIVLLLATVVYASSFSEIEASILKYEPVPAEQGNTVDVWIQVNNPGTKTENVFVRFEPEYPFSLPAGQPMEINFGTIAATEDKVERFTVFVDPSAPNGDANVQFLFRSGISLDWTRFEDAITIQTQDAVLIIDDLTITPTPVKPGQTVDVEFKLRNAGRISVKNVDVSLDLEDSKFSTIGSGAKKRIDYIASSASQVVKFTLASDTSTEVKLYSIPVSLSYQDQRNKEYDDSTKISLIVNAEPELSLTVDSTDFEKKTMPGTVSLKIVNKGIVDLKYVTVKLITTPEYDMLSPSNEEYVGNLDNDDFETVDFLIKPKFESPRLKVILEFKDPYNVDFSQTYDLPLRIITDEDLGKEKSKVPYIIGAIVLVLVIYWWRKRKKKKKRR